MASHWPTVAFRKRQNMTTQESNEALAELGFAITSNIPAGFVDGDWPCVSYEVTITFKGKEVIRTTYRMGLGFVDIKKARPDSFAQRWSDEDQEMIYTWERKPYAKFQDKQRQANIAAKLARRQNVTPALAEVLHCLLMDGEAFFNAQSFEDWASDFGYDSDSRKAEEIYRKCDATGRKLAQLPREVLEQVRQLTADL